MENLKGLLFLYNTGDEGRSQKVFFGFVFDLSMEGRNSLTFFKLHILAGDLLIIVLK